MKNLVLFLGLLVGMMSAQSQSLATFDVANKDYITAYSWTSISSESEQMQIADLCVEFVAEQVRMTHETKITDHITKSPTRTSSEGQVIKGKLYSDGKIIGTARFAYVGTSIAGSAEIGNDTYKFSPDEKGDYSWVKEQPFQCGTDDTHHNCDVDHQDQTHGAKENHQKDEFLAVPPMRNPTDCTSESIQDVAFITDDLMDEYGNDLNAILAQIAISDSWATDIMADSDFPDIAFFQESVHVVDFAESGTTWGNIQVFNDSLYATPPGIMATIMQNATSSVTVLYSLGGGADAGVATISVYPMSTGYYYKAVLGNNNGIGNYVKMHEYGHALWGGEHEDITPNPVLYRRAYLGTDATWGQYATVMAQGNFGGGVRVYRFSDDDPNAGWYSEPFDHTFSPVGNADRDMCRRITEEWNRPGIVQVVTIPSPTVTTHPSDETVCEGGAFTLTAAGNNVDSYQWYKNGTAISGATSASYTVSSATAGDAGSYYCELSNTCDVVNTNTATVTVNLQAVVTTHPQDVTVFVGNPFTLTSAGNNVTGYQWYHDGSAISGATSASYSVSSAAVGDAGAYYCELSNSCGSVNTNTATVTVESYSLTIDPTSVTVSASSGNTSFAITSNESWTIVTSDNLVIATPSSGTGNSTINVSYPAINTMAGETYTATVTSGSGIVELFTINQDGVIAFITLTPDNANVPANAGSLQFSVDCPDDLIWGVTGLAGWLSAAPLSGMGQGTVTLNYEANTDPTSRSDDFSVSGSGATDVFSITQVGANAPLEASALSDKPVYTTGQPAHLFGSATGGTGSYSYEWTGTGGFSSTEQNPIVVLGNEGHYTFTLIVNDGENTVTDDVEVDAFDVWFTLEVEPLGGTTDDIIHHRMEIHQRDNDPRTVTYNSGSSDFYTEEGSGNVLEWDYQYPVGVYDVEGYYELSDGSSADTTWVGIIDIILGQEEISSQNINIYPNPTSGNLFISTGKTIEKLSVINGFGSEVFHQENLGEMTQVSLSSFPSGLYFVRIYVDAVFTTQKVVKR